MGVAIESGQTGGTTRGIPPGLPLPPQVSAPIPTPLAYGFQGKPMQRNGMWEFNNRMLGRVIFMSIDPLEWSVTPFGFGDGNRVSATDPEGLYTVSTSTCSRSQRSEIIVAMDNYVRPAIYDSFCIGNVQPHYLRNCMRGRYGSSAYIGCSQIERTWCGFTPTPGNAFFWIRFHGECPYAYGAERYGNRTYGKAQRLASLLLHELTHTCGATECIAYACSFSCRTYVAPYNGEGTCARSSVYCRP